MAGRGAHAETSDVPSPRTAWSVHNKKELATWHSCHGALVSDATAYMAAPVTERRLVLFGDSITESWRGTSYGRKIPRAVGVRGVLNTTLGRRWPSPLPLGIAADCTQHLLWRMAHGELSPAMAADPRLTAVLLIGTNNLGKGHSVGETVRGIVACAHYLLNATRGRLLVNALLPRGDTRRGRGSKRKGRGALGFVEDIAAVNAALNGSLQNELAVTFPERVRYVDCGASFHSVAQPMDTMKARRDVVRRELMPDRLHPNAAGHQLWGECLVGALVSAAW